jgi:hypothetical protein
MKGLIHSEKGEVPRAKISRRKHQLKKTRHTSETGHKSMQLDRKSELNEYFPLCLVALVSRKIRASPVRGAYIQWPSSPTIYSLLERFYFSTSSN